MSKQFLALSKQTVRNALDAVPTYLFYPISGKLEPEPEFKEEPRKEYRGADTRMGYVNDLRRATSFKFTLDGSCYPGAERGALLRLLVGYLAAAATVDASAFKHILFPISPAYGTGQPLTDEAIALVPNTDKDGITVSQNWVGARPKSYKLTLKGLEDVKLAIEMTGGPWIGAPGQAETAGASFPVAAPFLAGDAKCYIGSGAALTGVAPNYTDIAPGTMNQFLPDDLELEFNMGYEDIAKLNGEDGPSVTQANAQVMVKAKFTVDYTDPASGWSSYDEWAARFTGINYLPLMVVLDNGELAGAATQHYTDTYYMPKMKADKIDVARNNEGKVTKATFEYTSRLDPTINKPFFFQLIDKAATY